MKLLVAGDFFVENPNEVRIAEDLKQIFNSCDYRIVNFEAPIYDDKYTNLPIKSGPRLMQASSTINLLDDLNIDALTLANNHIMDQGENGFIKTIETLEKYSLLGAGTWENAYKPLIIENDGVRIGIINLCELQFGVLFDEWSQSVAMKGCAWINHPKVNSIISRTKQDVDYLIAVTHAGLEMVDVPLPEWRSRYREMIDVGCDAIIGTHPHVPQGYELYNGKPIFYSLGNFCFTSIEGFNSERWNIGEIVELEVSKANLSFTVKGISFIDNRISVVDAEVWASIIEDLNQKLETKEYISHINEVCSSAMRNYWSLFNMGGLIHPDKELFKSIARHVFHKYSHVHLLNLIRCESHRWCISRALNLNL